MAPRGPESPDHTEDIREMDMHFTSLMRPDPLFGLMGARKAGVKKVPKMTFDIEHDEQLSASEGTQRPAVDLTGTGVGMRFLFCSGGAPAPLACFPGLCAFLFLLMEVASPLTS